MSISPVSLPGVVTGARIRCRVCGFSEVRTDEVVDRGQLLLAECPRCEHRFTYRVAMALQRVAVVPGPRARHEETASAA